jgi:hypothetical protein
VRGATWIQNLLRVSEGGGSLNSSPSRLRWLPILLGIILVSYAILYQCFTDRLIYFDEVGLFNPVYMSLQYGKMTYPAHGQFDTMFVHPPTQYFLIATLMRTGLSVYHAAGLLSVLLFAIFVALVVSSKFSFSVQTGFLLGGFLGFFIWCESLVLRPDLTLALSWAGGLVALETARLDHWNRPRLAIGGLLLALATGVHYPGVLAGAGVPLYAFWIWKDLGWRKARVPLATLVVGSMVYAVPDLIFFLAPHLRDVINFSLAVQHDAPPGSAFQHHMQSYAAWAQVIPQSLHLRPLTTILTEPILRWYLPAAFIGPMLLLALPSTRVLALAALPHLLFILFGARHKQVGYTGYFIPEMTLYFIAAFSVLLTAIFALVNRLNRCWLTVSAAIALTVAAAVTSATEIPALVVQKVVKIPGIYDFEVGRAAARNILGQDAVVGTVSAGVWYTSGATYLYFITSDLIYPHDVQCLDLKKYFASFDALAVDPHQSWVAYNRQRRNITSSYIDGILQLRGFFFADRRDYYESGLSYMLYSASQTHPLVGYGVKGQHVFRFQEQAGGDQVFLSALCPTSFGENYGPLDNTSLQLDFYAVFFRPVPTNEDPRSAKDHNLKAAIITLIADRPRFERVIRPALTGCAVRDEVSGLFTKADLGPFIRDSEKRDQPIHFYRTYADLKAAVSAVPHREGVAQLTSLPSFCSDTISSDVSERDSLSFLGEGPTGSAVPMPGALRLDSIALAYKKADIAGKSPVIVTTAPEQWAYAASIPIVLDRSPGAKRVIHFRGHVVTGQIGIGILDQKANSFQQEEFLSPTAADKDYYLPIPAPEKADKLIIRNTAPTGTVSVMSLTNTEVLAPAHRVDTSREPKRHLRQRIDKP